jgi:choline dehydrogenase-like flavoprotein
MRGIDGKVGIVTGGSSGIGPAIAIRLAQDGANVAINYVGYPDGAESTRDAIERSRGACMGRWRPSNLQAHGRLIGKFKALLETMRCRDDVVFAQHYLGGRLGINGVAHQNGTVRFGHDPTTSALDINCRLHELDNTYVVDASFFVSSSAVNPTLTIIANALRVADHLTERLGAPLLEDRP